MRSGSGQPCDVNQAMLYTSEVQMTWEPCLGPFFWECAEERNAKLHQKTN